MIFEKSTTKSLMKCLSDVLTSLFCCSQNVEPIFVA